MGASILVGRLRVGAWVSLAFLILLPSCRPAAESSPPTAEAPRAPMVEGVIVTALSSAEVDPAASAQEGDAATCRQWTWTGPQAEALIALSREVDARAYRQRQRGTSPCRVGGLVRREGRTWQFTINAAGQVVLKRGNQVKYLDCDAPACRSLVTRVPARSPAR
jgi:hypothetical protein